MKKNETVRSMTQGQIKDIAATIIGAIPLNLTFDQAAKITGGKKDFVSAVDQAIKQYLAKLEIEFLRRISEEPLIIKATDGRRIIAEANDVFRGLIDKDFRNWGADEAGLATDETPTIVYEMVKDGDFLQLFSSIGDIKDLCFTQDQIISFVEQYTNWLRTDEYGTFFLFQSKNTQSKDYPLGEFFVAYVHLCSDSLYVYVHRLEDSGDWYAENRHRVVVPQRAL